MSFILQSPRVSALLVWLLKGEIYLLLRSLIKRFQNLMELFYGQYIVRIYGQSILVLGPEGLKYKKGYEPNVSRLFCSLIEDGQLVIDVGASLGYYTLLAARKVGNGKVIALEPNPLRFRYLQRTIKLNRWQNVKAYKLLASDSDGETTITLDSLVERADLVKIDVEGMELEVLRGMRKILKQEVKVICEIHPSKLSPGALEEISTILKREGYAFNLITDEGTIEVPELLVSGRQHYYFFRN